MLEKMVFNILPFSALHFALFRPEVTLSFLFLRVRQCKQIFIDLNLKFYFVKLFLKRAIESMRRMLLVPELVKT